MRSWFRRKIETSSFDDVESLRSDVLLWDLKKQWYDKRKNHEGKILHVTFEDERMDLWVVDLIHAINQVNPDISIACVGAKPLLGDTSSLVNEDSGPLILPGASFSIPAPYRLWRNVAFLGEDVSEERAKKGYDLIVWFKPEASIRDSHLHFSVESISNKFNRVEGVDLLGNKLSPTPVFISALTRKREREYFISSEQAKMFYELLKLEVLVDTMPVPTKKDASNMKIALPIDVEPSSEESKLLEAFGFADPRIRQLALGVLRRWLPEKSQQEIAAVLIYDLKSLDDFNYILGLARAI